MAEPITADVVIVGGGPAGLGAALALRGRGVGRVLVVEREQAAGGAPRHCGHPPFGMREFGRVLTGPAYAGRLVRRALAAGVDIRVGHSVVAVEPGARLQLTTPHGCVAVHARRAIVATGARESSRHARLLSGDRPLGVVTTGTLQAMVHLQNRVPFRRPVIVGTELVSLASLLTCRHAGIRPVAMVEANTRATANQALALFPRLLGIPVHYGAEVVEIVGGPRIEHVVLRLAHGGIMTLACDGLLLTGDFVPEAALVRVSHLDLDPGSVGPAVDQFGRCSDPVWFAAGNVLRPVETAGWCHREGWRIGGFVADDLAGRLGVPGRVVEVERGPGIRLVVPQRLALPLGPASLHHLQLRVARAVTGTLSLAVDGVPVWQRRLSALPERRTLVPLGGLRLRPDIQEVEIGFG